MSREADTKPNRMDVPPIQLENPMKAYKKAYLILILAGTIAFAAVEGAMGVAMGVIFGWTASYLFIQAASGSKLIKMNTRVYPLKRPLTDDELFMQLASINHHPEFKVEQGNRGLHFTFKNTTMHTVHINKEKLVYSITSKLTKKKFVKKRYNPIATAYIYAYTAVPYITQMIGAASNTETRVE